jgi:hypothetical protein
MQVQQLRQTVSLLIPSYSLIFAALLPMKKVLDKKRKKGHEVKIK